MLTRRFSNRIALAAVFLAASTGAEGGGSGKKPTLEEQLTAARAETDNLRGQVTSLTSERDTAVSERETLRTENARLTSQFAEATNAATNANAARDKAVNDLATMTTDRDTQRTLAERAQTNVTRLETLCGVKGIDPKSAVPAVDEPKDDKTKTKAEFDKLTPAEKSAFCKAGGKII